MLFGEWCFLFVEELVVGFECIIFLIGDVLEIVYVDCCQVMIIEQVQMMQDYFWGYLVGQGILDFFYVFVEGVEGCQLFQDFVYEGFVVFYDVFFVDGWWDQVGSLCKLFCLFIMDSEMLVKC